MNRQQPTPPAHCTFEPEDWLRLAKCWHPVARACDSGQTTRFDAAGAILLASENAFRVAGEAVQALGGAGYTKDWPVERFLRDAKLLDIGAGTNEIRRMLIGRELFDGHS